MKTHIGEGHRESPVAVLLEALRGRIIGLEVDVEIATKLQRVAEVERDALKVALREALKK